MCADLAILPSRCVLFLTRRMYEALLASDAWRQFKAERPPGNFPVIFVIGTAPPEERSISGGPEFVHPSKVVEQVEVWAAPTIDSDGWDICVVDDGWDDIFADLLSFGIVFQVEIYIKPQLMKDGQPLLGWVMKTRWDIFLPVDLIRLDEDCVHVGYRCRLPPVADGTSV